MNIEQRMKAVEALLDQAEALLKPVLPRPVQSDPLRQQRLMLAGE